MVDVVKNTSVYEKNKEVILKFLQEERQAFNKRTHLHVQQIESVLRSAEYFENTNGKKNVGVIQTCKDIGKSGIIALLPYALGARKCLVLSSGSVITKRLKGIFGGDGVKDSFYCKSGLVNDNDVCKFISLPYVIMSSKQITNMPIADLVIINAEKFVNKYDIILNENQEAISSNMFDYFDTIIVDDAHHYPAQTLSDIIEFFARDERKIIFLTDIHNLENGEKLHGIFDKYKIYEP